MSSILEAVKRVNLPGRVEESLRLRLLVLLAVLLAAVATGFAKAAPAGDVLLAVVALPIGAWVSRLRAGKPNYLLKALLAIGAIVALSRFFRDVQSITAVELARQPLASLFLSVQVLHGFDLPARRDLGFTLASSLTLIALAATSTFGMWFLAVLALYGVLGVLSMLEMQRSAARQRAQQWCEDDGLVEMVGDRPAVGSGAGEVGVTRRDDLQRDLRSMMRLAVTIVLLGALTASVVPRGSSTQLGGLQFRTLPFRLPIPSGLIDNPGLVDGGRAELTEGESPPDFNPAAYFGFAQSVDLRTVGTPSPLPVLRVRADRARLWRGMVFETYTGIGWTRSSERPEARTGTPVLLDRPRDLSLRLRVVQTVELVTDTPNLLFAAADPVELYVGGSVEAWQDGTLSTPATMSEGTIYSAVSLVNVTPREELRQAIGGWNAQLHETYTQLPDELPQRVRQLAAQLTAGAASPYLAAEAVQQWIGENTEYRLDAPPPPLTGDVVDHFLFTARQGWCEPIAASMVVLLRAVGIPARFATGFQPGSRNPVTGVFDVRLDNAHAWVEVNIPGYGWVDFDPTGAVPTAVSPDRQISVPLVEALWWVRDHVLPAPLVAGIVASGRLVRDNLLLTMSGAVLLALALLGLVRQWRARTLARRPAFERLEFQLSAQGLHRPPGQTLRGFIEDVAKVRRAWPRTALEVVLADEEARRYGGRPPDRAAVDEASSTLEELASRGRPGQRRAGAGIAIRRGFGGSAPRRPR